MWSDYLISLYHVVFLGKIFLKIIFKIRTFGFENLNIQWPWSGFVYFSAKENIKT
jgi:hypothetical protein